MMCLDLPGEENNSDDGLVDDGAMDVAVLLELIVMATKNNTKMDRITILIHVCISKLGNIPTCFCLLSEYYFVTGNW